MLAGVVVADYRITGADDLARAAKVLRQAGNKELTRDFYRGLNRAVRPAKDAAKRAAETDLPQRGGFAAEVARSRFSSKIRTGQKNPQVTIWANPSKRARAEVRDLRATDRGRLRHPLFGNRDHWFTQQIKPGWFTNAMRDQAPQVQRNLQAVMRDTVNRIARSI